MGAVFQQGFAALTLSDNGGITKPARPISRVTITQYILPDHPPLRLDCGLLVANKPSGLLCQPGLGPEGADSLLSRLQQQWPTAQLVHRLDRDTSGLLLLALNPELHRALSRLFAERRISKIYRADVRGTPRGSSGSISLAIAKQGNRPPLYAPDPEGKVCHTDWSLLESLGDWSRLELHPLTGRSHQLRVHMAASGHPILGDPLYGDPQSRPVARLHLHATRLSFIHPLTGQAITLCCPCPF
jgi:tRNA pseudouridine32 synthase/23S rRNA pseudouridine746 synthase